MFVAVLFGLVFLGCGKTGSAGQNTLTSSYVFKIAFNADPGTLDPWATLSGARQTMLQQVYEPLATIVNGEVQLVLAKSARKNTAVRWDYPVYDIEIWDYIYDSAGNHFTADDVIYCLNKHKSTMNQSVIGYMDRVEKTGDYSVRWFFNSNTVDVFENVVFKLYMCTQAAFEADVEGMSTQPVGTGIYKMTEYVPGNHFTVTKRDDYWQTEENKKAAMQVANVNSYEFRVISEANQIVVALENGDIDYFYNPGYMGADTLSRFMEGGASSDGITVVPYRFGGNEMLFLNCAPGSPFENNVNLRQAVMHAIDVDGIVAGVLSGYGIAAHDIGVGTGLDTTYPKHFDDEPYFDYDENLAKKYFAESGYRPGGLTLRIMTRGANPTEMFICQVIQANLAEIGINVDILGYENALYEQYVTASAEWDMLNQIRAEFVNYASQWLYLNKTAYGERIKSLCFVDDDTLYEKVSLAMDADTTSEETLTDLHNYVLEKAYCRGLVSSERLDIIRNSVVSQIVRGEMSKPMPGAFIFVWNK
jgi:ABC-type transport system substrate-binding protein